jgi:hypothetical protein
MSAALRSIRTDYDREMEKVRFFVPLRYLVTILLVLIALSVWGLYKAVPAIVDLPVVHRSHTTSEITRIEIGGRVYTPDSDPQWKTHRKQALAGRYELVYEK